MLWRVLQTSFFLVGAVILLALFAWPSLGLHLLWNVLIPVAPALLVIATSGFPSAGTWAPRLRAGLRRARLACCS
jgi:hypothetical protein